MKIIMVPPFLKEGDKIAIISPAGRVYKERLRAAIEILKSFKLEVVLGEHVFDEYTYLASSDDNRLADLQKMINDDDIKAIVASRGGYGSVRLLDRLDISNLISKPKWIVGFSDITVLHCLLNSNDIPTIHGMMANDPDNQRVIDDLDVITLRKAFWGKLTGYVLPTNINSDRQGECEGEIFGGNLSIITSLLGTPYSVNPQRKILFIEEIGECYYQIDRMIQHLKYAGVLSQISGLIIGGMTDICDTSIPLDKTICDIVYDAVGENRYPICFNFPAGHIGAENRALYFGIKAKLSINSSTITLTY